MIRWATDYPGKKVPGPSDMASPSRSNSKRPAEPLPDYGRPSTPRRDYGATEHQSPISDSSRRRAEMVRWREVEEAPPLHRKPPQSARPPFRQEPYSWTGYLEEARLQEHPKHAPLSNAAIGERQVRSQYSNGGYHGDPQRERVSAVPPVNAHHGRPVSHVQGNRHHKDIIDPGHIFKGNHEIPPKNINYSRHSAHSENHRHGRNVSYVRNGMDASYTGDGRPASYKRDDRPASYRVEGRPASSMNNGKPTSYSGGGSRPASYRGDDRSASKGSRRPASNNRENQVPSYMEEEEFAPRERNGGFVPYADEGRIDSYVFMRNDRPFQDNVRSRHSPRGPEGRPVSYM